MRLRGLTLLTAAFVSACGCTRIEPGTVGIVVDLAGEDRGVEDLTLETGWVFYNPAARQVFQYPYYVQTATWKEAEQLSFNDREGLQISGDISLSYQLNREKIPAFYVKFRSDDLDQFTHGFLRNVARDVFNEVAGKYPVEDLYGPRKEEFLVQVRDRLNREVADIGVEIVQLGFIGAPRPPKIVVDAINMKVRAVQQAVQAENELRREQANAQKQIARAQGASEANRLLAASISDQLIQWRQLEITEAAINKWNGVRPTVEAGENAGGLLLQVTPRSQ